MTIRTALWLFSYVGVSLALAVGNRIENPAESPSKGENTRVKLESDKNQIKNNLHLRAHQYDGSRRDNAVHDWLMYDELQPVISPGGGGGGGGGLQVSDNEMRRYRDVVFDELSQPLLARRNPLPFIYEEALFQQQQQQHHHARKRPGGFKQSKKVVGLPPLVYGGTEEETPPGPGQPDPERSNLEDLYDHDSRGTGMSFENMGGLPFEPPDSPHKPQGGGIGLSPLLFETEKPPGKRTAVATSGQGAAAQLPSPPGGAAIASQFMLRSARGNRQYDVPQIECPSSEDGMERFACPTPDRMGRYRCIDDHVLCDGFIDCPTGEDEDRQACMFYKTTKAHLDVLADALLRWARGR